jgi:hypothetical protein
MQSSHILWKLKRHDYTGFGSRRVEAIKKELISELSLPKPGGMCYHHNLDRPEGRGARGVWRITVMGLRIGPCADVLGPRRPCK